MAETERQARTGGIVSRAMEVADIPAVAALLAVGFARWRDRTFWDRALRRLAERDVPAGLPRFGWVLASESRIVGILLALAAATEAGDRINLSSWYVEPDFRLYGALLVNQAFRLRGVVFTNVSPAPETWTVLAAQRYRPYVAGRAVALPALARRSGPIRVAVAAPDEPPGPDLTAWEATLLQDHARWDCLSLVCTTPAGRVPFVFALRRRRGLRFAYLVYCRSLDSFAACARPLGWFLLRRLIPVVVADADARLPAMPGHYQPGFPKFVRGAPDPHPGDLAYSERAILGV